MTDYRTPENLRIVLTDNPEKNWYKILAEYEGREVSVSLEDIIKAAPDERFYYSDFIRHLEENDVDLGFKLGRASNKIAEMLTDLLGEPVIKKTDTHRGVYLLGVSPKSPEIQASFTRPAEINQVIREAREERRASFKSMGLTDEDVLAYSYGTPEIIAERMRSKAAKEKSLKDQVNKKYSEIIKQIDKNDWMGKTSIPSMFRAMIFRAIIESDEIFESLKQTEMYDPTNIGAYYPTYYQMRKLEIADPHIAKWVLAEIHQLDINEIYGLFQSYNQEDLEEISGTNIDLDNPYIFALSGILREQEKQGVSLLEIREIKSLPKS